MTEEKVILKELKQHACTMATDEARALVMNYYIEQEYRKSANNQCNALSKQGKSTKILEYFANDSKSSIKLCLKSLCKVKKLVNG